MKSSGWGKDLIFAVNRRYRVRILRVHLLVFRFRLCLASRPSETIRTGGVEISEKGVSPKALG